jgi:hypothetical protein
LNQEHAILLASFSKPAPKRTVDDLASSINGNPLKRQRTDASQNSPRDSPLYSSPALLNNLALPQDAPQNGGPLTQQQAESLIKLIDGQLQLGKINTDTATQAISRIKQQVASSNGRPGSTPPQQGRPTQPFPPQWTGALVKTVTDNAGQRRDLYAFVQASTPHVQQIQNLALFTWPKHLDLNNQYTWDLKLLNGFAQANAVPMLPLQPLSADAVLQSGHSRNAEQAQRNEALYSNLARSLATSKKVRRCFRAELRADRGSA